MDNKHSENVGSNMLLTGCIFLANIDITGLTDYAIKAIIGGGIWLGYKLAADFIDKRRSKAK